MTTQHETTTQALTLPSATTDVTLIGASALQPGAFTIRVPESTEVLRIDHTGMTYKGQRIEDAGEAYRAFMEVMGLAAPTVKQSINVAEQGAELSGWIPVSERLPLEGDGEVLVRMRDRRCEIAWATYWHGSSSDFAQWTFRDPDEDELPTHWMLIPPTIAADRAPRGGAA